MGEEVEFVYNTRFSGGIVNFHTRLAEALANVLEREKAAEEVVSNDEIDDFPGDDDDMEMKTSPTNSFFFFLVLSTRIRYAYNVSRGRCFLYGFKQFYLDNIILISSEFFCSKCSNPVCLKHSKSEYTCFSCLPEAV